MGNVLRKAAHGQSVKPHSSKPSSRTASQVSRSSSASRSGPRVSGGLGPRISGGLSRLSAAVRRNNAATEAANSRHQLEERLAEAIKAKAAADAVAGGTPRPTVTFNRLLLRFASLHAGFAACRAVFRSLTEGNAAAEGAPREVSLSQLREACTQLGYNLDDDTLTRIFASADVDGSSSLNADEFVVVLAILHILKGPEDEERVDPAILRTWRTVEEAFMCFASSKDGYIAKVELMRMMHEVATDGVRHSATGNGTDPIQSIAAKRFAELDREGRGRVSFLEFLFCLEEWVEDAEEN